MNNWNLERLYTSFDSEGFQGDLKKLDGIIERLNGFKGSFDSNIPTLESYLKALIEYYSVEGRLGTFSSLSESTNTTDEDAIKHLNLLMNKEAEITEVRTLAEKWIAGLDIEKLAGESSFVREHTFYLNQIKEGERYSLDEKTEVLLSKLNQSGGTAWSNLQGLLTSTLDVDMEVENTREILTLSEVRNLAFHRDSSVRKAAFEAELKSYEKIEKSIASSLNSIKGEVNTITEFRGYSSPVEKTLMDSRMTQETLDALLSSIREYLPHFRRYLKRKSEILGYSRGLPFYELFAPIGNIDNRFTIEEAQSYILKNFGEFSEKLAGVAKRAFDEEWIDYSPKKGKVGGAFCANIPSIKESRILSNFTGSFSDVLTLAHELGHAYHGDCIFNESLLNTEYTMPVAETASIMCETIIMKKAIFDAGHEEKIFLLESSLQDITQVAVDILSRYIFEDSVFNERRDTVLSSEQLKKLMVEAQKNSYGEALDEEFLHPYMWINKGHYYSSSLNFYNFPYAFGALFGKGLYSQYLKDSGEFVPKYDNLLRLTGQKTVEEAAQLADIDVTDIEFWRGSLDQVKEDIDLFLELTEGFKQTVS